MTGTLAEQVRDVIGAIRTLSGVTVRSGVSEGDLVLLERRLGCHLPAAYRALLAETNGLEVAGGCKRWLGYGPGAPADVVWWNDPTTWKWAYRQWYGQALNDFLVLAVDPVGNQTGCFKADLQTPGADPSFYSITPIADPVPSRGPLSRAILGGLPSMARQPRRGPLHQAVLERYGDVPADRLVMRSPFGFPHFSDDEFDLEGSMLLPMADAMVAMADLWRETDRLHEGDRVVGVDLYTDDQDRQRLRFEIRRAT